MKNNRIKLFLKCVVWGGIATVILYLIGILIVEYFGQNMKDVFFVEGLIAIGIGIVSSVSGDPMSSSLQGIGQSNAQYIGSANLEISKMANDKGKIKNKIDFGFSSVAIIIGGSICLIASSFM